MTRQQITFLAAGFLTGIITAAVGTIAPTTVLIIGVGPLFFLAILAAVALTNSWSSLSRGFWRYVIAALASTGAYILALMTFSGFAGYSPELFGVRSSNDISNFGADVWIGFLAASVVAAVCVEFVAYVLTSRWSNAVLARLAGAGALSVVVTFIGTRLVRLTLSAIPMLYYWSFLGILFSVGEGLFCALVGAQIWKTSMMRSDAAMTR